MILFRMFPERGAPVVGHERLYYVVCARGSVKAPLGLKVRARDIAHAEEKFVYCLEAGLRGKTLAFDLEAAKGKEAEGERRTAEEAP